MKFKRFLVVASGAALTASTLVVGAAGLTAGMAGAAGKTLFVATTGSGTTCVKSAPCATIGQALAIAHTGATINVAKGTYTEQVQMTSADNNVTIKGAGATKTIIQPPATGLVSDSHPDDASPQFSVVDVAPGTTGVSLKSLGVNGANAIPFYDTDGLGCAQDPLGIYFHDAAGSISSVDVTGIDLPADLAGCQAGQGILVASDTGSSSFVRMSTVALPTPAGASFSGPVFPAYDKNGIACRDIGTTCIIARAKVQGVGPTGVTAQNGIEVFGATASISKSHVSNDSYNGGGNGNQATGILALNGSALTINNNKVSASDNDIYAGLVPAFGHLAPTIGTWTIEGNTASAATDTAFPPSFLYGEGIEVDSTTNPVIVEGNTTSGNHYAGVMLLGVTGATVESNTGSNNNVGLYVGGPGSAVTASTDNTVVDNTFTTNQYGVIVDGAFTPKPPNGTGPNPGVAADNTFGGNTWTGNFVQAADFSGSSNPSTPTPIADTFGSPTADSCEPTAGGAPNSLGPNFFAC